jgi:hypothetical protein
MRAIASLVIMASLAVAGCADPSRESDAVALRGDLAGLPGVTSVRLDYTRPVILDSGKLALEVGMIDNARVDQVAAVIEMAYDSFRSTHHREEADLSIAAGRTTVALRAFEPDASVAAVTTAVLTGLTAAPEDGWVAIDLTTQDVPQSDHVAGTYVVTLPERSTAAEVPALLESLAAEHDENPLIGWGGAAADGSSLTYDAGFPPDELVVRWVRLETAGLPVAMRAFEDGLLFVEGHLTSTYDVTSRSDRRALDQITRPQLRTLGAGEWVYDLIDTDGGYIASIDRVICESTSEGPYDDKLEAWVAEKLGSCRAP